MTEFFQVSSATATREQAMELARSVVAARLVAGVQVIGPVASVFWHHGEYGEGEEWQILMKVGAGAYSALEDHLLGHHPWENPEVAALPIVAGSPEYLRWLATTTDRR
ncbi:divalent-cation tolerance protein CutA [Streptomyces chrestomyceticus]|uniref:divalent-cation tolerance protein CutA n=1 Tax=Streptomyces chrestomyceticus TaxID=68185 RepID=UPI0033FA5A97